VIDREILKEVLAEVLAHGGDFADVFLERRKVTGISVEDSKIERVHSGLDAGAGIRVINKETTAYAYTNDLSKEGLLEAARLISKAGQEAQKAYNLDLRQVQSGVNFSVEERPDAVEAKRKVEAVKMADEAARTVGSQHIKQVMVGYGDTIQQITLANSAGEYIEDERIRTRLTIRVVTGEGETIQTGYEAAGSITGFELFKKFTPTQLGEKAARRAVAMLKARPAPTGKMPVILAGEAGGTMIHEACGHGLEADLVLKGLSVYAGKKGQKVSSELVTVIDDATIPECYGSYRFDDEGVPAQKIVLIENGVLKEYLYDRFTASQEGRFSNGHGRRESYQHKPIPRMGNTYIAPGKTDPAEIIKAVKKGVLVKKMGGGQVNTITGDFVFDVVEGYLISAGEIGPMIRGAVLTGNGPEVLRQVEMIGCDLGFNIGTCGKDGQGVPVGDAQPTMLIRELVIGGTQHNNSSG